MRRRAVLILSGALGVLMLTSTPVSADHAPSYGPSWQTYILPIRHFTPSVSAGQWRDRISNGMDQWNALGETLQYRTSVTDKSNRDPRTSCAGDGIITMHRFNLDGGGGLAGFSGYCYFPSGGTSVGRQSAWIIFDSSEEWCLGTGDCYDGVAGTGVGADVDLWSIASHEWGHVGALGHYLGTDTVCGNNDSHATMCPSTRPGTERDRSLQSHDSASYRLRY